MARTICIYHANCCDGFAAAWAARRALGPYVEFIPAQYKTAPPDVSGADVVIVDFSYKRPVLEQMALTARSILVLDHHKTAQSDLAGLPEPVGGQWEAHRSAAGNPAALFDMSRSGAQMAWDFFFPDDERPFLIDVVADRDLWRWQIAMSRELNAVIASHPFDFTEWNTLARKLLNSSGVEGMAAEGAAILRAHDKLVEQVIATSKRHMRIGDYVVPVAAAPYALASDVAGRMAQGQPFAATYVDGPSCRTFSLRSRGDGTALDVQDIAQSYGGGGHSSAAGFSMPVGWEGETV